MVQFVLPTLIHWIVIYPVDNIIHTSSDQALDKQIFHAKQVTFNINVLSRGKGKGKGKGLGKSTVNLIIMKRACNCPGEAKIDVSLSEGIFGM